jgi:hypothetical protein
VHVQVQWTEKDTWAVSIPVPSLRVRMSPPCVDRGAAAPSARPRLHQGIQEPWEKAGRHEGLERGGAAEFDAADQSKCLRRPIRSSICDGQRPPRAAHSLLKPQTPPSVSGSGAFVARLYAGAHAALDGADWQFKSQIGEQCECD